MTKRIFLSPPHQSGEELKSVAKALESNWVAPIGPAVTEFERQIASYNAIDYCVAVSSGTAAIHLALNVLGVGAGDEVICSTFTFSGSCNPIVYQSATPVFVDSEEDTWNMDPALLEDAIKDRIRLGRKPKAIIVVHLFGMPAKMSEILSIARQYDIPIIEDAAEALGSMYGNRHVGTLGDIGVFSFNGNKIITTSGGGALVSFNREWVDRARFLSSQSRSPVSHYEHEVLGYNYQLSNICASIGVAQFSVLNDRVSKRRKNFYFYKDNLSPLGFTFQPEPKQYFSNRWLTTVLTGGDKKLNEKIMRELADVGIETRPLWKPMHLQPAFRGAPSYLSGISESFFNKGLCLPSGSSLEDQDLILICDEIKKMTKLG